MKKLLGFLFLAMFSVSCVSTNDDCSKLLGDNLAVDGYTFAGSKALSNTTLAFGSISKDKKKVRSLVLVLDKSGDLGAVSKWTGSKVLGQCKYMSDIDATLFEVVQVITE